MSKPFTPPVLRISGPGCASAPDIADDDELTTCVLAVDARLARHRDTRQQKDGETRDLAGHNKISH